MSYKVILPYVISVAGLIGVPVNNAARADQTDDNKNKIENYSDSARIASHTPDQQNTFSLASDTLPINVEQNGKSVIYVYNDGRKVVRNGGSRAWRNNNPGNLRYYNFAKNNGAIGEAGKFAVFPDEQTGMRALQKLLQTDSYKNLSIANALKRYDPGNWRSYTKKLTRLTGLSANTKLSSLNDAQLHMVAQSIRRLEGWIPGQEQKISAPQYAMLRNAQNRAR